MATVVTYQAPDGATLDVCPRCERKRQFNWPRNTSGEYCTVSEGEHDGVCDVCGDGSANTEEGER